jgi:hypothetical protein
MPACQGAVCDDFHRTVRKRYQDEYPGPVFGIPETVLGEVANGARTRTGPGQSVNEIGGPPDHDLESATISFNPVHELEPSSQSVCAARCLDEGAEKLKPDATEPTCFRGHPAARSSAKQIGVNLGVQTEGSHEDCDRSDAHWDCEGGKCCLDTCEAHSDLRRVKVLEDTDGRARWNGQVLVITDNHQGLGGVGRRNPWARDGCAVDLQNDVIRIQLSSCKEASMSRSTNDRWYLSFGANPGSMPGQRDFARLETQSGALVLRMEPPKALVARRAVEEGQLAKEFVDNARLAAAGKDTFNALKKLLDVALAAGINPDAPAIKDALEAIAKAAPPRFEVRHESSERVLFEGTKEECGTFLRRTEGLATSFLTVFGGFSIEAKAPELSKDLEAGPAPAM